MPPVFSSSAAEGSAAKGSAGDGSGFGIGAQVGVQDASSTDLSPWPDDPSGIIVRAGGSALAGVWGRGGGARAWIVEFDEPQSNRDGGGPFATAQILEKYLELAPPVTDTDTAVTAKQ